MRAERAGGHHAGLMLLLSEADLSRVGHCWMRGRLRAGDLVMAVEQSGDCFWQYVLVDATACNHRGQRLYHAILASEFGAYVLGTPAKVQPTARAKCTCCSPGSTWC